MRGLKISVRWLAILARLSRRMQLFGFAGKHGAADHFYPAAALPFEMWFEKHY
jgi:hypothetical protein